MTIAYITASAGSVIIGLLLAVLVYFVAEWLLGHAEMPRAALVAAILALLVFFGVAFGW